MQSCSKSTPTGMTCDYAPYAYKKKATFSYKTYYQNSLSSSGILTNEITGDTMIDNILYANVTAILSDNTNRVTKGVVRCGNGVFVSMPVFRGRTWEVKMLKENPSIGDKWTSGPFNYTDGNIVYTAINNFEVISTNESKVLQSNSYTNLIKVKSVVIVTVMNIPTYSYVMSYWDKANGLVMQKTYNNETDLKNDSNEIVSQELISLI